MELELSCISANACPCMITLFLYGIGAMLGLPLFIKNIKNYIIPIWNWSQYETKAAHQGVLITLFLYGIGAKISFS